MAETRTPDDDPLFWSIEKLGKAYQARELSPVEVWDQARRRSDAFGGAMNVYVTRLDDLGLEQAKAAEAAFRSGTPPSPLCGIPVSIKDAFEVRGYPTTFGSLKYRDYVSARDSASVARLREAGAVLTGKTNTSEFGQSATTDNLLGPDTTNAWNVRCTAGGSSGGAASSVAAGLATVALGSDGGGSIRIPAAFSGLFGIKPTFGLVQEPESIVKAMSDFVCPGPLSRHVDDARRMLAVLSGTPMKRGKSSRRLRIAWCAAPEDRPVAPAVQKVCSEALKEIVKAGFEAREFEPPISDWQKIFGPLVLQEEFRERGRYLDGDVSEITDYELASLRAAAQVAPGDVADARERLGEFRQRFDRFFEEVDVLLTPTNAVGAFEIGQRPVEISGRSVSALWGAFPFTAAYNVAGVPAASIPCGLADGMPAGLQVVMGRGRDAILLDFCELLERIFAFDQSPMRDAWRLPLRSGALA